MVAGPSSVSRWTSGNYQTWVGYLAQENKSLFILKWAFPGSRVLPVQVKSIKPVSSQELNGRLHKRISVGLCRHHFSESVKHPWKEQRLKQNICIIQAKQLYYTLVLKMTYFWVPKAQPPTANSVFRLGFLWKRDIIFLSVHQHRLGTIDLTFVWVHWKTCKGLHHSIEW